MEDAVDLLGIPENHSFNHKCVVTKVNAPDLLIGLNKVLKG